MKHPPRWNKKQLAEFNKKGTSKELPKPKSLDRFRNNTEREFAAILEARKARGEILDWKYEPFHIRLANNTFIIPDFIITEGLFKRPIVWEVKGEEKPAWKAKWKIFCEMYRNEFDSFHVVKKIHGVFVELK